MGLINAEKLLETLGQRREYCIECAKHTDAYTPVYRGRAFENECIAQIVEDMAATPVDPVKHAHWVDNNGDSGTCCNCGERCDFPLYLRETGRGTEYIPYEYCPHCGYMMDEVRNETD